jgi:GNAT superfamily N-acetyltransferase
MNITIRKGIKTDIPQVLNLIKELAMYEKAPQEVTNTVAQMEKEGFGENPAYEMFVAEINATIVGIAVYFYSYSTWKGRCMYLDDIVVTESMRGKGIGDKLFKTVINKAKEENVPKLHWQVLDWNEPAINFYQKFKADLDPEWINGKLTREQIQTIDL